MIKKIALISLMLITLSVFSQNEKSFLYLVGNDSIIEYKIKLQECVLNDTSNKDIHAPILHYFHQNKKTYIGYNLEDELGNKTKIKNIFLLEQNSHKNFTTLKVEGENFSREIRTNNGCILKNELDETVFFVNGIGKWKIINDK